MVSRVRTLYEGGMSQVEVADELGVSQKVIWKLMINHDIPRRPQVKRDQWGANNSSWKGGAANYQALHMRVGNLRGKLLDLLADEHVNGIDHGAVHNGSSLSCRNLLCHEMRRVRATLQAAATVEVETAQY